MTNIRCFVDFNTAMQFAGDRVIINESMVEPPCTVLRNRMRLTVYDEDQEADGTADME